VVDGKFDPACAAKGDHLRGVNMPEEKETNPIGTGIKLVRLKWALYQIVHLETCLLADAQEIAKEALREAE